MKKKDYTILKAFIGVICAVVVLFLFKISGILFCKEPDCLKYKSENGYCEKHALAKELNKQMEDLLGK